MRKGCWIDGPEQCSLQERALPTLSPHMLRVKPRLITIKHGTMFHLYSGKSPFEGKRFCTEQRLFIHDENSQPCQPAFLAGAMAVGTVIEIGSAVSEFKIGDEVYGLCDCCDPADMHTEQTWLLGELRDDQALCLDPAIFALGGLLDARAHMGDRVFISGLGAIGLIAVQIARHNGLRQIAVSDPDKRRRELAMKFGADIAVDPIQTDIGAWSRKQTDGQGFDIAIEYSGNSNGVAACTRALRQCGRLVTVGYYHGGAGPLQLGAEWLHNRLEMISSLIDWGNPMRSPGWDRKRVIETAQEFMQRQWIDGRDILQPQCRMGNAPSLFDEIYRSPANGIKLCIQC